MAGESTRRTRWSAAGLGGVAALAVAAAVALSIAVDWSWDETLDAFVVTNSVMGLAFAGCGAVIAWHRPGNPIGWLFVADGLGHATAAAAAPLTQVLQDEGAPESAQRLAATVFMWSWPWSIALFMPLALLLFPDGRLPSRRWRWAAVAVVATAPLFVLEMGTDPTPPIEGLPTGYVTLSSYDTWEPLWLLTEVRTLAAVLLALVGLVFRYRRASESGRRQLLWLLLAVVVMVVLLVPWSFVAGTPVVVLFAIPLVPVAVAIAIVRHQLLDIRLVVSRTITWASLSALAVVAYVGLVAILDTFVSTRLGRSAAVTVIVALLLAPILPRLQRAVDRAMYGDRRDPARVATRVARQLSTDPTGGLAGVTAAIREGLRLPYVAVSIDGETIAESGRTPQGEVGSVALEYAGRQVGALVVGLRTGESELSTADGDVLALIAVPLSVAVHATALSNELQASRGRIVAAREEERRRLRRDLHDGLGPTLTGMAFSADAAANLVESDVEQAQRLLDAIRSDSRTAIADVRRLVDDLRPPALDDLGLVDALRQRADQMSWRADGGAIRVQLEMPDRMPALPAALEVAAYRIATEALTNVVRHSRASIAVLRLHCDSTLDIEVTDDGAPNGVWRPGVGLRAMRERVAELGGCFDAGPSPDGGRVFASFPLGVT
jgi:two-component system, NarL family, sensor kinase